MTAPFVDNAAIHKIQPQPLGRVAVFNKSTLNQRSEFTNYLLKTLFG